MSKRVQEPWELRERGGESSSRDERAGEEVRTKGQEGVYPVQSVQGGLCEHLPGRETKHLKEGIDRVFKLGISAENGFLNVPKMSIAECVQL